MLSAVIILNFVIIIYDNNNFSYIEDKCCRHKRLLSHDCVKCIKYKDSKQLKRSLLNDELKLRLLIEVKCIHGNDSSKCEKCSIQDSDKMLCIHGNDDSSKCEKCSIQDT